MDMNIRSNFVNGTISTWLYLGQLCDLIITKYKNILHKMRTTIIMTHQSPAAVRVITETFRTFKFGCGGFDVKADISNSPFSFCFILRQWTLLVIVKD